MRMTVTDVYEGSFLLACGAELAEVWVDRRRRRRSGWARGRHGWGWRGDVVVFAFEGGRELEELQRAYRLGVAEVNVGRYRECLNIIRRRLRRALAKKSEGNSGYESTGAEGTR